MNDVVALASNAGILLEFFVPGFLFVEVFAFVRNQRRGGAMSNLLLKSAVASALLCAILDATPLADWLDGGWRVIVYAVVSALAAYGLALATKAAWFKNAIYQLGMRRTSENNIWCDAFPEPGQHVYFYEKGKDIRYYGWLMNFDEHSEDPVLILAQYVVQDLDGNTINDNSENDETIILRASDARRIEVVPYAVYKP